VDTGGTFTDCLARDPDGRLHRAKVLSTSALRAIIAEPLGPTRLRIHCAAWGENLPRDLVRGFRFRLLTTSGPFDAPHGADEPTVARFDPVGAILELDAPLSAPASPGAALEVRSPEEAPVLAARLVTRTPPNAPLPPLDLRLATTRGTNALLTRTGAPPASSSRGALPICSKSARSSDPICLPWTSSSRPRFMIRRPWSKLSSGSMRPARFSSRSTLLPLKRRPGNWSRAA
jgi:hypothetical protein